MCLRRLADQTNDSTYVRQSRPHTNTHGRGSYGALFSGRAPSGLLRDSYPQLRQLFRPSMEALIKHHVCKAMNETPGGCRRDVCTSGEAKVKILRAQERMRFLRPTEHTHTVHTHTVHTHSQATSQVRGGTWILRGDRGVISKIPIDRWLPERLSVHLTQTVYEFVTRKHGLLQIENGRYWCDTQ